MFYINIMETNCVFCCSMLVPLLGKPNSLPSSNSVRLAMKRCPTDFETLRLQFQTKWREITCYISISFQSKYKVIDYRDKPEDDEV